VNRLVDQLLASPRYGERWARAWLDVARYSDTEGYQVAGRDIRYPYAYTFRDWVIKALNDDMPYDKFLSYQLAADKIERDPHSPHLAALGFLTVGDTFIGSKDLQVDDRIDVVTRGMLGLSVGCARCHDHKYDPIPAKDYYSLYSIFASSEVPQDFPVIGKASDPALAAEFEKKSTVVQTKMADYRKKVQSEIRTREAIVSYLSFIREVTRGNWQNEEFRGKAGQAKLNDKVATHWQKFLTAKADHSVFQAWTKLSALSEAEFPEKSKPILAELTSPTSKLNDAIKQELIKRAPIKGINAVAQLHADVFLTAQNGSQPANEAWKQVKELLALDSSPLSITVEKIEAFFTRADFQKMVDLRNEAKKIEIESAGAPPRAMVMLDRPKPEDVSVFIRGNPGRRGERAPRGNLTVLGGQTFTNGSGRLELAQSIAGKQNPLTARVWVNRIWHLHFGSPIAPQPSDFGVQTPRPLQADVLDYLAYRFMESSWSIKALHRMILTSGTFAQASSLTPEKALKDADNALLSRFTRQRLDYETMKDAINAVSGTLDVGRAGGRSTALNAADVDQRRSVYHFVDRYEQPTEPAMFDFANPDAHSPQRYITTVPQQSLFLMNSPFMKRQADRTLAALGTTDPQKAIVPLYRRVLLRDPKPSELELATTFVKEAETLRSAPATFSWRYGTAPLTQTADKKWTLGPLTPFKHFLEKGKRWSPSEKMPVDPWGHLFVAPNGGHPGRDACSAVLQWVSPPQPTKLRFSGNLKRQSEKGNGVRVVIHSRNAGILKDVIVPPKGDVPITHDFTAPAGDTLSFVVDSHQGSTDSDGYSWTPRIEEVQPDGKVKLLTRADEDWCDTNAWPLNREKPQTALGQLAQVLLMSNEFMFLD